MAKTFAKIVYAAWGMPILNYVVPTAATAGLLIVFVRTLDGGAHGIGLWLGWFASIFFVVSTGHSEKHDSREAAFGVVFDLIETLAMVAAFHSLGLVMGNETPLCGAFFIWLGLYLLAILGRRLMQAGRNTPRALALRSSGADRIIFSCTWIATAACLAYGVARTWLPLPNPPLADYGAAVAAWIMLLVYIVLAFFREKQLPEEETTHGAER